MNNTFPKYFRNFCDFLGNNNNSLYGALTIAVAKGILRPTITMMDKKQDKKTRQYTAFREGTTGAVAFISYLATNAVTQKFANALAKASHVEEKLPQIKATATLVSVSITALFLIPYVCNKITTPLMHKLLPQTAPTTPTNTKTKNLNKPNNKQNFTGNVYKISPLPSFSKVNTGLRIGG